MKTPPTSRTASTASRRKPGGSAKTPSLEKIVSTSSPAGLTPSARIWASACRTWAAKIRLQSLENMTINGMEAATATASGNTRDGPVFLRLVAIRYDASTIYRFIFLSPAQNASAADAGFRQAAASFRKLSASEAAQIKPLRVRVITVKTGDSVSSLAKSMAFDDYQEQRFRVLNGLAANETLAAGQRVKLIVE